MSTFIQASFNSGLNRLTDPTRLNKDEYSFLVNGRTRFDTIAPIKKPKNLTIGLPSGVILQAVYSVGNYTLIFASGKLYIKDETNAQGAYIEHASINLDPGVARIYAEVVPASTVAWVRSGTLDKVSFGGFGDLTPRALVIQDGVNQPWLLFPDGSARQSQTYTQWNQDQREYVPIGRNMMYLNGVLYIVSVDGTMLYRSVTGRPLDFMVIIDTNGDKLPQESDGGAAAISHRVDYNVITALHATGTQDGSFVVSTAVATYIVTPNYTQMAYGEPSFKSTFLFATGCLNQFSILDLLGDTALIDFNGLRTFNSVLQLRNEGRNAPFSAKIQNYFDGIVQTDPCCIEYDNYALFSVQTVFGPVILVYDMIKQAYVAHDTLENMGAIKQFAVVRTPSAKKLVFITQDNQYCEAYTSDSFAECSFYFGEACSNDPSVEFQPRNLKAVLINAKQSGTITAECFVDRQSELKLKTFISESVTKQAVPITPPFGLTTDDTSKVASFDFSRCSVGWKLGFLVTWNFDAELSHISAQCEEQSMDNSLEQAAREQQAYLEGLPSISTISTTNPSAGQVVVITGDHFDKIVGIKIGDTMLSSYELIDYSTYKFTVPYGLADGKLILVTDTMEVESNYVISLS